jgi:drug/metabolite transporter (DMT)-like permease
MMPYARFLLLCLIWGSSFLLMKRAGAGLSPWAIAAGRVCCGLAVLAIVWAVRTPKRGFEIRKSHLTALIGVMLLGYAIPYAVQPLFISRTGSSSLTAMGVGFTPLFTLLLSVPLLSIRPTVQQVVGVLGALGCLVLLLCDTMHRSVTGLDVLLLFSTPLMYALANIWMRTSLNEIGPLELTIMCLGMSALLLVPLACGTPGPMAWTTPEILPAVGYLAVLGIFGTGLGMLLFNQMVQQQGPLFAAMVTNLTPIGAVLLGWGDAEHVTWLQLVALMGVLVCVAVVQRGASKL